MPLSRCCHVVQTVLSQGNSNICSLGTRLFPQGFPQIVWNAVEGLRRNVGAELRRPVLEHARCGGGGAGRGNVGGGGERTRAKSNATMRRTGDCPPGQSRDNRA